MARAVEVVVFDLDGTLTDSEAGIISSYRHALHAWDITTDYHAIRQWIGPPLQDGFLALGVPAADVDRAILRYRDFFSTQGILENRLFPGISSMLASLTDGDVVLAVATSKLSKYAMRILDQLSISAYFDVVVGATPDGTRLHKEKILDHALAELGRPVPSTVVMVGDREHDVRAAIKCGVHSIGVTWGYGTASELIDAGVEGLAANPSELTRAVFEPGTNSANASSESAP